MTEETGLVSLVEIVDAETKVSEVAIPGKVTGYLAFYQSTTGKWEMVTSSDANRPHHPILPYWSHETKQEAVKAAMAMKYAKIDLIKIVAVEFEL